MSFEYRVEPLPAVWPASQTETRKASPFRVNWTSTMELLRFEVQALEGSDVILRLAVRPQDIRQDGGVKANARVKDPSVILEFKVGADRLSFPCDRFNWWEDNVRAIALALEALRKVDRYGVRAGRQYEGFKALPPGAVVTPPPMDLGRACATLTALTNGVYGADDIRDDPRVAQAAIRAALRVSHPDAPGGSGSVDLFQNAQEARAVLSRHHGERL